MKHHNQYLLASVSLVLLLCYFQISGSSALILGCLLCYILFLAIACFRNYTLPLLLFFLPWSPLMKINPDGFSFYTMGLLMVCLISILKKKFRFKSYHIAAGVVLAFLTILAKLIDGSWVSFDYIAFIMLIVLFPVVKEEYKADKYDFYNVVVLFSLGIITAALCAFYLVSYSNISKYITVYSYQNITRMCGFYGDPNFYAAQITAAIGGCLYTILKDAGKKQVSVLLALIILLMYCGFMSGSKSFVIVAFMVIATWCIEIMRLRGRSGRKIVLIISFILMTIYITSSALFGEWIEVVRQRLSLASSLSEFTTGRTELWKMYIKEIFSNAKILFIGKGFTNVKLNGRAPHNTILQMLFQLGLFGSLVLTAWVDGFFKDRAIKNIFTLKNSSMLILIIGTFLPWLAIDTLFFDEFFLLQWYLFTAIQLAAAAGKQEKTAVAAGGAMKSAKRRRTIKITW